MASIPINDVKNKFLNGSKPNQDDFADLIDSVVDGERQVGEQPANTVGSNTGGVLLDTKLNQLDVAITNLNNAVDSLNATDIDTDESGASVQDKITEFNLAIDGINNALSSLDSSEVAHEAGTVFQKFQAIDSSLANLQASSIIYIEPGFTGTISNVQFALDSLRADIEAIQSNEQVEVPRWDLEVIYDYQAVVNHEGVLYVSNVNTTGGNLGNEPNGTGVTEWDVVSGSGGGTSGITKININYATANALQTVNHTAGTLDYFVFARNGNDTIYPITDNYTSNSVDIQFDAVYPSIDVYIVGGSVGGSSDIIEGPNGSPETAFILTSSGGNQFYVTVDDLGVLTTTAV